MPRPLVLFRADASSAMGLGHLMRCRAVAEAVVERGAEAVFAMVEPALASEAVLGNIPAELVRLPGPAGGADDLAALLALQVERRPVITVADGYHLSDAYQRAIAAAGPLAVFWDAPDRSEVPAAVVIDASPRASAADYARIAPQARMLLGAPHALIRRDLRQAMAMPGVPLAQRRQVLVTFGGSDPRGLTAEVASRLLAQLPGEIGVTALAGAAYARPQELWNLADTWAQRLHVAINPPSVVPYFTAAGLAVTAGGGTIGELAALGLPALVAVVVDNQSAAAGGPYPCLDARGEGAAADIAARAVAMWHDLAGRERLAREICGLVDGQGAIRVADALLANHFNERVAP
jgi:spore coat polysaccharide biosynthesis predicted glycosyltransferase SpsG